MAPKRRPGSEPGISIEVSPAYELLESLAAVMDDRDADTYDVGADWITEMRDRAGTELIGRLQRVAHSDADTFIHLMGLAYETPAPRDIATFLDHLGASDPDEIRLHLVQFYAREIRRMTPPDVIRAAIHGDDEAKFEFLRTSHPDWEPWTEYLRAVLEADGEAFKAELIDVLAIWAEHVFKPEMVAIMPILERDAEAKRELLRDLPADEFVTVATNGVEFAPRPGCDRVVMVPSFIGRPLVAHLEVGEVLMIVYP
ncbi:MAG: hypothetical protein ABIO99_03205, partial [Candidatus Limnocylindria bacterium]